MQNKYQLDYDPNLDQEYPWVFAHGECKYGTKNLYKNVESLCRMNDILHLQDGLRHCGEELKRCFEQNIKPPESMSVSYNHTRENIDYNNRIYHMSTANAWRNRCK